MKKLLSLLLAALMTVCMTLPALASETGYPSQFVSILLNDANYGDSLDWMNNSDWRCGITLLLQLETIQVLGGKNLTTGNTFIGVTHDGDVLVYVYNDQTQTLTCIRYDPAAEMFYPQITYPSKSTSAVRSEIQSQMNRQCSVWYENDSTECYQMGQLILSMIYGN